LSQILKIGYFADGPWSHNALDKILMDDQMSVQFICARFENPDSVLQKKASINDIPFFVEKNVNSDNFLDLINKFGCNVLVSMSFNQIFKKSILSLAPMGIINCHAGKLPFYRGRNILNWALINDEQEFGVTVHYVDEGIDTGDIILQETYPITDNDNYLSLLNRSHSHCANVLYSALQKLVTGNSLRQKQSDIHPFGFYCSQRKEGDEILNWNKPSRQIFNFVRAICDPGPQARSLINDVEVKINKVDFIHDASSYIGKPGAILQRDINGFIVKTSDSFVRVVDWSSSVRLKVGDVFV